MCIGVRQAGPTDRGPLPVLSGSLGAPIGKARPFGISYLGVAAVLGRRNSLSGVVREKGARKGKPFVPDSCYNGSVSEIFSPPPNTTWGRVPCSRNLLSARSQEDAPVHPYHPRRFLPNLKFQTTFKNSVGVEIAGTWFDAERGEWRLSTVPLQGFATKGRW